MRNNLKVHTQGDERTFKIKNKMGEINQVHLMQFTTLHNSSKRNFGKLVYHLQIKLYIQLYKILSPLL